MAKTKEMALPGIATGTPETALVTVEQPSLSLDSMFSRSINGGAKVKSIHFKKTLTRQLVSMGHQRELVATMTSEIYETTLPLAGRADKPAPAKVIDAVDLETNQDIVLVLNAMMLSALERSSDIVTVKAVDPETKAESVQRVAKSPLKGRTFGFRAGDIKADKRYRVVDVVEVEVERAQ